MRTLQTVKSNESQSTSHITKPGQRHTVQHNCNGHVHTTGDFSTKWGDTKLLTSLDIMTGSATFVPTKEESSKAIAVLAFLHFFSINGLPNLILIDVGSENAGELKKMCAALVILYHVVNRENHKAIILCERFHRYLNKVLKIHTAECQSLAQWILGAAFACYTSWNASTVNMTDIVRSFAAKGREFLFPIDISEEAAPARRNGLQLTGETRDYVLSSFPLIFKQRELLNILNSERRTHHAKLKNKMQTQQKFLPGDIFTAVQKQVQTKDGIPAKLIILRTRGPYRVLKATEHNPDSYWLQRIPALQGLGRKGKRVKESAARMEKIPPSLIVTRPIKGAGYHLMNWFDHVVPNSLENYLRIHQFGTYNKVDDPEYAFERVEDIFKPPEVNSDSEEDPDPPAVTEPNADDTLAETQPQEDIQEVGPHIADRE
eukprot:scaffold139722_cov33-Attheya_sp.AAC.1